ncbi:hypothetical protein EON81_10020, partial [bacterium]
MANELLPEWEGKTELIRRTVAAGATNDELELFLHMARRSGLDPLARQIHFVKRRGRGVVQVGIDGLRLTADRTGLDAGNEDPEFFGSTDTGYPGKAKVTVYKLVAGLRCAFTASARWDEYYPGDEQGFMWRKMPSTMLGKCAEALALRKAFPADLSGLFIHEEMEQAGAASNPAEPYGEPETPPVSPPAAPKPKTGKRAAQPSKAEDPATAPEAVVSGYRDVIERWGMTLEDWTAWKNVAESHLFKAGDSLFKAHQDGARDLQDAYDHMLRWIEEAKAPPTSEPAVPANTDGPKPEEYDKVVQKLLGEPEK